MTQIYIKQNTHKTPTKKITYPACPPQWRISWKKFRRKGQQAENDKTERVTGLGRRTRKEIAKWNQMTALRFQTGGRHQTSPASLRGCTHSEPTARCIYHKKALTAAECYQSDDNKNDNKTVSNWTTKAFSKTRVLSNVEGWLKFWDNSGLKNCYCYYFEADSVQDHFKTTSRQPYREEEKMLLCPALVYYY